MRLVPFPAICFSRNRNPRKTHWKRVEELQRRNTPLKNRSFYLQVCYEEKSNPCLNMLVWTKSVRSARTSIDICHSAKVNLIFAVTGFQARQTNLNWNAQNLLFSRRLHGKFYFELLLLVVICHIIAKQSSFCVWSTQSLYSTTDIIYLHLSKFTRDESEL